MIMIHDYWRKVILLFFVCLWVQLNELGTQMIFLLAFGGLDGPKWIYLWQGISKQMQFSYNRGTPSYHPL